MWFNSYRAPHKNPRLGEFIIDLSGVNVKEFSQPIDIALDAVYEIAKNNPAPYTLLASGGVDSQAMIYVWKLSGIPFRVVHYNYLGLNSHDTEFLIKFCQLYQVDYEIIDFDAVGFITSELLKEYAKKYDCSSPQILTYIRFNEQHSETTIMSGNFYYGEGLGINYTIFGLDRFREKAKSNFVPFFFCSTPSLTFLTKYLTLPNSLPITNDGNTETYSRKCEIFNHLGVTVIPQPTKYTGFEKIKELFDNTNVPALSRIRYKNYASKRPFDILYRYSLYEHITLYNDQTRVII